MIADNMPWNQTRLGELLTEVDVRVRELSSEERESLEILSLTKNWGLIPQSERFNNRIATEDVSNYKVVRRDWIVYNPYVIWEGAVHALRRFDAGIVSPVYPVWERNEADGGFLDFLLRSDQLIAQYQKLSQGAVNRRRSIRKNAFQNITLPLPPLPEQRQIAAILTLVQHAITQQERLITLTTELKTALMHKLFTEGLHGEPQKMTEIGPIPENWGIGLLGDCAKSVDYGTSVKCGYGSPGYPVLRIPNVVGETLDWSDLKSGLPQKGQIDSLRLQTDDLLFVRTNGAQENAGRCSIFAGEQDPCYFASYLIRVRVDSEVLDPSFLNFFVSTAAGRRQLAGRSIRTADGKFNINSGTIKSMAIPLPTREEQSQIIETLVAITRMSVLFKAKSKLLSDLFRTLLQQLMTAQIRVTDLFLSALGSPSPEIGRGG